MLFTSDHFSSPSPLDQANEHFYQVLQVMVVVHGILLVNSSCTALGSEQELSCTVSFVRLVFFKYTY